MERMNLSELGSLGLDNLYLMVWKKRTDMISDMDAHDVGCPELLADVDLTEWILNLFAMSLSSCKLVASGLW